jgi:hypothetical protein
MIALLTYFNIERTILHGVPAQVVTEFSVVTVPEEDDQGC